MSDHRSAFQRLLHRYVRPVAKRVVHVAVEPGPTARRLYGAAFDTHWATREASEWLWRSLVATPLFLSRCASHGERIAVDRLPYIQGHPRIELGSDIRISGQIGISGSSRGAPVLKIGSGVFIASGCSFNVASRIELGDYVSIGRGTYIADTEGHSHYNPQRPIWEVPAGDADVAPVLIEDNVQISRECMILKGVRVGARSVIGARSVVRSDIPPDSIVMGNPARVVKRMTSSSEPQPEGRAGATSR